MHATATTQEHGEHQVHCSRVYKHFSPYLRKEGLLFPHDMAGALMKEMVHESNAQFVVLGTPGTASAMYACLEMKMPVIAIVKTEMHKTELLRVLKERLVSELSVTGATLACCDLVKRAEALGMVPTTLPVHPKPKTANRKALLNRKSSNPKP